MKIKTYKQLQEEKNKQSVFVQLSSLIKNELNKYNIKVIDIRPKSQIKLEDKASAMFDIKTKEGSFPVRVEYELKDKLFLKQAEIFHPEIDKFYGITEYSIEIPEFGEFLVKGSSIENAIDNLVDYLFDENETITFQNRIYSRNTKDALKEILKLNVVRERGSQLNEFQIKVKADTKNLHPIEKIAEEFISEVDVELEANKMDLSILKNQIMNSIRQICDDLGIKNCFIRVRVKTRDKEIEESEIVKGEFDITTEEGLTGTFPIIATFKDGLIETIDIPDIFLYTFGVKDYLISFGDRSFKVSARNEKLACIQLLNYLEKEAGTSISFDGKIVTERNKDIIAEDMLEKVLIKEITPESIKKSINLGSLWKIKKENGKFVLERR